MIKEVTYYDIICDRCDKSLTEESEMRYLDKDSALMVAEQSDWVEINGKNYCPDCYELDEETDEYVEKCERLRPMYYDRERGVWVQPSCHDIDIIRRAHTRLFRWIRKGEKFKKKEHE